MGSSSGNSISPAPGESVIVVMDANRGKESLDALDWAIKYIVGSNDTVVVLGVLPEIGKKASPSCLPFHIGIGTSGIWVKLEFSVPGEMTPSELQQEIGRKTKEYQKILQPFYHHCKKREVKLDVKLAAGYESKKITVDEAKKLDPRWVVLDGYLKKDKEYIQGHVDCHVALLKSKGIATLIPSKITGPECEEWQTVCRKIDDQTFSNTEITKEHTEIDKTIREYRKPESPHQTPLTPCWYPLSWRTGFPRVFSLGELEEMTRGFSVVKVKDQHTKIYGGMFQGFPVVVVSLPTDDDQAVSLLKIVSRVRHRNVLNLVGYCCVDDSVFFLSDCPSSTLEAFLLCDESATKLSWKSRCGVALEIGAGICYLHEDCVDGSVVNLSVCSANVSFTGGSSAMLSMYHGKAKQLKDFLPAKNEQLSGDIKDYGTLLLELISGQSKRSFEEKQGQSLVDWALPLLEKNSLSQLTDPRLTETSDPLVARMARAALVCLRNNSSEDLTISKVMAVVRGTDQ